MPAARFTELGSLSAPGALADTARVKRTDPRLALKWGSANRVSRTEAINLSWKSSSQVLSSMDSMEPPEARPALCTTPSIRPQRATDASTKLSSSAGLETSAGTASTSPPVASMSVRPNETVLVAPADGDGRTLPDQLVGQRQPQTVSATGDQDHFLPVRAPPLTPCLAR